MGFGFSVLGNGTVALTAPKGSGYTEAIFYESHLPLDVSMRMNLKIYLLLQIPGLIIATVILIGVGQWFNIPLWIILILLALWVAKDLALYPFIRESSNSEIKSGPSHLIGKRGVVRETLEPKGYIQIGGELWRAETQAPDQSIPSGGVVSVREARGLTLVVDEIKDHRQSHVADRRHPEEETGP